MTLLELLVVLVVLGLTASSAALSLARWEHTPRGDSFAEEVAQLRRLAVDSARTVTRAITKDSTLRLVTALPDGSVLTDIEEIDRFTGRPVRRER